MRLWHYALIPYLPNEMLVAQWRELIAIKRQWEKGTLKHRLVSYVTKYQKSGFDVYVCRVCDAMDKKNIKYQRKYLDEIEHFCLDNQGNAMFNYPEHDDRYLTQCYYNLQEKYDRGIVNEKDWLKISDYYETYMEEKHNG